MNSDFLENLLPEERDIFLRGGLEALTRSKLKPKAGGPPEYLNFEKAFKERPNLEWVVPQLILRGTVNFLGGAGGRGKSLLALYLCAELATGLVGGFFTGPEGFPAQRVLLVNLEDPAEILHERLYLFIKPVFEAHQEILNKNLKIWPAIGDLGPLFRQDWAGEVKPTEHWERLAGEIQNLRPRLVIIDTLMRALGITENDNALVGKIFTYLEKIAKDHNISWLLIHHPSKIFRNSSEDVALRGASGFADAARSVWTAVAPSVGEIALFEGRGPVLKLSFPKVSYGLPKNSVLFHFEPEKGVFWKEIKAENLLEKILTIFNETKTSCTSRDLARKLKRKKTDIDPLLQELVQKGILKVEVIKPSSRGGRPTYRYTLASCEGKVW